MKSFELEDCKLRPEEVINCFKQNGVVHLKKIYPTKLCSDIVNEILLLEKSLNSSNTVSLVTEDIDGKTFTKYFQGLYGEGKHFKKIFSYQLMEIASMLINSPEVYYSDLEAHLRNPGGGSIPKHQDNFYFNLKEPNAVTCYIALTEQDHTNGALRYITKTHEKVIAHSGSKNPGFSSYIQDSNEEFKKIKSSSVYNPSYEIGDVTIHHPNNIHFADPAPSNTKRSYALSARIFPQNEIIDDAGVARYQKLLSSNRD